MTPTAAKMKTTARAGNVASGLMAIISELGAVISSLKVLFGAPKTICRFCQNSCFQTVF